MAEAHKTQYANDIPTPIGRVSYPHLVEKDTGHQYSTNAYDATLLIPKSADTKPLQKAILALGRKAFGKDIKLSDLQHPLRDGDDTPEKDGYEGCWVLKAKNKIRRPAVIDRRKNPLDPEEIVAGYDCRFVISLGTYVSSDTVLENGKRKTIQVIGIGAYLDVVQFVRENETFGEGGAGNSIAALDDLEDDDLLGDEDVVLEDDDDLLG